jgi:hypothetical protein
VRPVLIALAIQLALTAATTLSKLRSSRDDTDIYHRYAMLILDGKTPYRDFRVEYPPLSLPLFIAAGVVSRELAGFKVAFGLEMLAFNAATVWLVADRVEQAGGNVRARLAWYTLSYALLSRLVVSRYDAAPMLVAFAASAWSLSERPWRGGAAAGLGTLLKVYPAALAVVIIPFDLAQPGPRRGAGLAAFAATLIVGLAGWLAIGGTAGVSESLGYQLGRGFEYGSLYSGLQMLAAKAAGVGIDVVRDHAAWSSVTPWTTRLLPLVLPIQAATALAVGWTFVRRGLSDGARYGGAAILAFIITGKVFSPQYLLWLLPFIAAAEGPIARRASWLFTAGCGATLIAPALASWFPRTSLPLILAYNAKNLAFLALLAILVFGRPAPTKRAAAVLPSME